MKRYHLKQEYGVDDEIGKPIKSFGYQLYLQTNGVEEKNVLNMFSTFASGFTRFLGEEVGAYKGTGEWPDFRNIDVEIDENMKFDDGTPLFKEEKSEKKGWFK